MERRDGRHDCGRSGQSRCCAAAGAPRRRRERRGTTRRSNGADVGRRRRPPRCRGRVGRDGCHGQRRVQERFHAARLCRDQRRRRVGQDAARGWRRSRRRPAVRRQTHHRRDAIPAHGGRLDAARGGRRHQRARSWGQHDAASGRAGGDIKLVRAFSPDAPIRTRARRNRWHRWEREAEAGLAVAEPLASRRP